LGYLASVTTYDWLARMTTAGYLVGLNTYGVTAYG